MKINIRLNSPRVLWFSRLLLAGIFLYAGIIKIIDPVAFAYDIGNFKILHPSLVFFTAFVLPPLEVICGILILTPWFNREVSLWFMIMLAGFIGALLLAIIRGLDINCGCFGKGSGPVGFFTLTQDIILFYASWLIYQNNK